METKRTHSSRMTTKTAGLYPHERMHWRRMAELREKQGRPDLAAVCLRIANR